MAPRSRSEEMRRAFAGLRGYFVAAGLFSLAINLLYLASPLYMLQVYDRVISSASQVTLAMLTVVLLLAFATLAALDVVRSRVLGRAGVRLDALLARRVVGASLDGPASGGARSQPIRDFDSFRQFATGPGVHALFDLPWAPIYIAVIYLLHPALGLFALGCAVFLVLMALANEALVRGPTNEANEAALRHYSRIEAGLRNAEAVRAMGMIGGLIGRWWSDRHRLLARQAAASERAAAMGGLIRFLRLAMQSLILGLGAYLVIERQATAGAMFAASLLLGRALQPVDQVVGSWKGLLSARGAYLRVRSLLAASPPAAPALELPRPVGRLAAEGMSYVPPGTTRPILRDISFHIEAGMTLGIVGASGAGKSTLARHIVGVLRPTAGAMRLDGADIAGWPGEALGRHIGYLPQDVELFADTIAANIGRFGSGADAEIVAAAQLAGAHEMILRLPNGYQTEVGEGGAVLSGGYRQRIGLARAVFGAPSLVVLDEPSSNLDSEGDSALAACIGELKRRGTTVVIISHRPATLTAVDRVLVLQEGTVAAFGGRNEIIAGLTRPVPVPASGTFAVPLVAEAR